MVRQTGQPVDGVFQATWHGVVIFWRYDDHAVSLADLFGNGFYRGRETLFLLVVCIVQWDIADGGKGFDSDTLRS
ncbi:hypothetical protein D3C78_1664090 [compost metagenome]